MSLTRAKEPPKAGVWKRVPTKGRIGANCCGTHLAIIKQQLNSITITTVDTGNLCTCGCLYCFEIKIPVTITDTIVLLNGYIYNIKNILNFTKNIELDNNNIELFPNPMGDNLSFKINGNFRVRSVTITDISGKQIKKYNLPQGQIDLKGIAKGVYIIYFETDNSNRIAKKIIKN